MTNVIDIHGAGIENAQDEQSRRDRACWRYALPDEREIVIYTFIFNARVVVGPKGWMTYDEGWCYESPAAAMLAAAKWAVAGAEGEPEGWIKNLQTGEFRDPRDPS